VGGIILALPQPMVFGETQLAPVPQSPQQSPQPTPTGGPRPVRFYSVDPQFLNYYVLVDGPRTLGGAISPITLTVDGMPAQYFEKARLENRTAQTARAIPPSTSSSAYWSTR
jgi:hypothetical protein